MMRLSVTAVLIVLAVDYASSAQVCAVKKGKKVITFSHSPEFVKFPCKYNAIKNTICGNWRITATPGNMLEPYKNKRYVIKTLRVAVENIHNGLRWEGRTSLKIAAKYLAGGRPEPFVQQKGALKTTAVFKFGSLEEDDEVSLIEKNNQFRITFGLFEPYGAWQATSGFKFECFSSNFKPTPYPTQLCGKDPVHFRTQSHDPFCCQGKPVERTNAIKGYAISLVRSNSLPSQLIGLWD